MCGNGGGGGSGGNTAGGGLQSADGGSLADQVSGILDRAAEAVDGWGEAAGTFFGGVIGSALGGKVGGGIGAVVGMVVGREVETTLEDAVEAAVESMLNGEVDAEGIPGIGTEMVAPFAEISTEGFIGTAGSDNAIGSGADEVFWGWDDTASDTFQGLAGNDVFLADGGADLIDGGSGIDVVSYVQSAFGVTADLQYSSVNTGDAAGDTYTNIEMLEGGFGNDVLRGDGTNNTIYGMNGSDWLRGRDGNDTLGGGNDDDTLYGDNGNDSISGGRGNDLIYGGAGNDALFGDDGNDTLSAEGGMDSLSGGDGNDFLNGGFAGDEMIGGAGGDTFWHSSDASHLRKWVMDYSDAEGDILLLGGNGLDISDISVSQATTTGRGSSSVAEVFLGLRTTGETLWAIQDGAAQAEIMLRFSETGFEHDVLSLI